MSKLITLLCADDHPLMRDGIAFAIQQQEDLRLVAEAGTGQDAVLAYRRFVPDVTLMDMQMPGMGGIGATAAIIKDFPEARIVIVTTHPGDIRATRAMEVGARGYLLKATLRTELVPTIRRVHAGQFSIPSEIAREIAEHVSDERLTAREIEVLGCLGTGTSNRLIAERLSLSEETVKGHVRNILAKLHAMDRVHAVLIAHARGYLED